MSDFFDDFNQFGRKPSFNPDELKAQGLKGMLRMAAPQMQPILSQLKSTAFQEDIAEQAEMMHEGLGLALASGGLQDELQVASDKLRAVPYADILASVKQVLAADAAAVDRAKAIEANANTMKDFTEDQYVALSKGVVNALPPKTRAAYALIVTGGEDIEAYSRAFYRMTPEQRVDFALQEAAKRHVEAIATAIHQTLQKATPDKLHVFLEDLLATTAPAHFSEAIFSGIDTFEDALRTVVREDILALKKPLRAQQFVENLEILLTAVEQSLIKAGIAPDIDLHAALTAPSDHKAVPKAPPRRRRPGNGDFRL